MATAPEPQVDREFLKNPELVDELRERIAESQADPSVPHMTRGDFLGRYLPNEE